jgi:2-oxoglutarate ferredoxin oxidoreductase subunit beta
LALIDVFQPCVTFNHKNTYDWFNEKIYKLENNPKDRDEAAKAAMQADKLPIGLFYQEEKPTYEDQVEQIKEKPLVEQDVLKIDIKDLLDELK